MEKYDARKYRDRCCHCGVYVGYEADSGTLYGCKEYDPPEPHDPHYYCKQHAKEEYKNLLDQLKTVKEGRFSVYWWQKPGWYMKAIKDAGFTLESDGAHNYSLKSLVKPC